MGRITADMIHPEENERACKAMELFRQGYNCAQSVVLAFADQIDIDPKVLASMSSSFGGGMGRLREVCGACSGMFLSAGYLFGYDDPCDTEAKKAHYQRIQELAAVFREINGSIVCRELLGLSVKHDDPAPAERTPEYYRKRPCGQLVGIAAAILDTYSVHHHTENG